MIHPARAFAGATALLTLATATAATAQTSVAPSESGQTRDPATPTVTTYPAAASGDGATTNGFNLSRWARIGAAIAIPRSATTSSIASSSCRSTATATSI